MVYADRSDASRLRIVVRPDRSMSWQATKAVYACMVLGLLPIALISVAVGAAPVLFFVVVNVLALGTALYSCQVSGQVQEVLSIDGDSVLVERGHQRPSQSWAFATVWLKVVMERDRHSNHLKLRSHGHEVEIGEFLCDADRLRLARQLAAALSHCRGRSSAPPLLLPTPSQTDI